MLNDGEQQREVDALRVFSESQVNALGIAAFVTRSKLLGHKMLIFDDPVQSMDEEHFKTFAKDVLNHVLEEGFQVILLTHNDTFAKDVSYYHKDRPEAEYVWGNGTEEIIEGRVPGAGKELFDILKKTVAGSHDKSPRGETDLRNSIKYIRSLLGKLSLGGNLSIDI